MSESFKTYLEEWADEDPRIREYLDNLPKIERPSRKVLNKLKGLGVTHLWGVTSRVIDRDLKKPDWLPPKASWRADYVTREDIWMKDIKPLNPDHTLLGPVITIEHVPRRFGVVKRPGPPDAKGYNGLEIGPSQHIARWEAEESMEEGDILLFASDGRQNQRLCGLFGDCVIYGFQQHGAGGIIVDGGIRDGAAVRKINFPVFCSYTSPWDAAPQISQRINVPVVSNGVLVCPGDVIVGDYDGVIVIPKEKVAEVADEARETEEVEDLARYMMRKGVPIRHSYDRKDPKFPWYRKDRFDKYRKMWEAEGKPKH
jgi:regulator of RNase E activity RraA